MINGVRMVYYGIKYVWQKKAKQKSKKKTKKSKMKEDEARQWMRMSRGKYLVRCEW